MDASTLNYIRNLLGLGAASTGNSSDRPASTPTGASALPAAYQPYVSQSLAQAPGNPSVGAPTGPTRPPPAQLTQAPQAPQPTLPPVGQRPYLTPDDFAQDNWLYDGKSGADKTKPIANPMGASPMGGSTGSNAPGMSVGGSGGSGMGSMMGMMGGMGGAQSGGNPSRAGSGQGTGGMDFNQFMKLLQMFGGSGGAM